jgi:hypothetical protein
MKHLMITSAFVLAFLMGISTNKKVNLNDMDYVVTEKGIFTPEDAKQALQGKFYTNSGESIKINLSDIRTFIVNGKEYRIK